MAIDPGRYSVRNPPSPKRFILYRHHDATGVSGTGIVATGVVWPDGHAALRWKADDCAEPSSTSVWSSVGDMMRVHGHGGLSKLFYLDADDADEEDSEPPPDDRAGRRAVGPWAWPPPR
jgi:hypothetical protein